MARILTADDNQDLCALLGFALTRAGHTPLLVHDGTEALARAHEETPDLVLLDTALPGLDGYDVAAQLRQASDVPIIVTGDRSGEEDHLRAYSCGADDYIVKPFSMLVLVKRIDVLLRRARPAAGTAALSAAGATDERPLVIAGAAFYSDRNEVIGPTGKKYHLTPKEGRILTTLARHRAQAFSASSLLERVWGYDTGDSPVVVKTHVYHLRRKLHAATGRHTIHTVPGSGYVFDDSEQ